MKKEDLLLLSLISVLCATCSEAANIPADSGVKAAIANEDADTAREVKEMGLSAPNGPEKAGGQKNTVIEAVKEMQCIGDCIPMKDPYNHPHIHKRGAYRDCKHAREQGHWRNGVYMVQPDYDLPAFKVYCDMTTDGGGWTVIQRRQDGSENFYRSWNDYVRGFGNLQGELFLGLYKIHLLTEISGTQLRVDLEDFNSGRAYAMYNEFSVDDSESEYTLEVSGYSGTAGDSLSSHNEMKFSTYDQDNDMAYDVHCAQEYKGGWWYNHCFSSNLNGAYLTHNNSSTSNCQSVVWYHWKHSCTPLRRTVMMIRSE